MGQISDKLILDRKFLEFWGNLFLNIAKGQEHIEQLSSLMNMDSINKMDFMNFKEMANMFRQIYGLPLDEPSRQDSNVKNSMIEAAESLRLNESFDAFQSSFAKYITLWGWIPKKTFDDLQKEYDTLKDDHAMLNQQNIDLQQEYDALKEKLEKQNELISQLRNIVNTKGLGHVELFQHIQNLAFKQTSEFQNLIHNIQNLFKTGDDKQNS